jgi:8-oxo-dGTP pyrophosphatase MutT (NUDIX family)
MPAETIPAATLILFRDRAGTPPELLMIERAGGMAFAGGAMVFPGGRIDPGDRVLAGVADDPDDAAARIAAIRETLEESGLAVGLDPFPDDETTAAMRAALHDGQTFGAVLAEHGIALALDALQPWARWCPNFRETRNFDTRFYIARSPENAGVASADEGETVRLLWTAAADMLSAADRGEAVIIFPTRRNLERLAQFDDYAAAAHHAAGIEMKLIQPFVEQRDDERFLCILGDQGYPVTAQRLSEVRRG